MDLGRRLLRGLLGVSLLAACPSVAQDYGPCPGDYSILSWAGTTAPPGPNLLSNPHFDSSTAGWTGGTWFATCDAAHSTSSGSAMTGHYVTPGHAGCTNLVTQCVTGVTPGTRYVWGGKIFVPSMGFYIGSSDVTVTWSSDATCTSPLGEPNAAGEVGAVAPAGAASALVSGRSCDTLVVNPKSILVFFDDLFFQAVVPVEIPALSGEGLVLLGLGMAIAGLLVLRARIGG